MANRVVSVSLIANVGSYIGGMNTAAAATMRLGESAKASTKKAQSGFDVAGKGALLMGAAVVGGMATAIGKSMEFEKAMSAAAAATTATGSALGDLRDAAMKAGADTQYSATEAAQAITEMGKAGVSTADILDGGLNGALSLAAAGQLDVAKAAEIASVAMTQFNLSGDQLPHVADLLAAGAGKAMGSVEDLGMALNQAGLVASATGVSIEETTGTLAAFASAGLIGSDAGTSFRSMLQHLQNPSKESATAMADLGINMYDANGAFVGMTDLAGQLSTQMSGLSQAQRDQAMAQIFGSDAVRAANVLYSEGAEGIAGWTSKVNDAGYAAEQAAKLNDNLSGDLERLGGAFDTLMIALGEGAQGPLREIVQLFTGILEVGADLIGFWNSLPGPVQTVVVAIGAFAALRGPMSTFLTMLHEKSVMGAVGLLDIAQNADRARGGLANLALAATEMAVVAGFTKAVTDVVEFTKAGDDARAMIDRLRDGLEGIQGPAKFEAQSAAIKQLKDEMEKHQAVLDEYESYNAVEWTFFGQFALGASDVKNAEDSMALLRAEIDRLKGSNESAAGAFPILREAFTTTIAQTEEAKTALQEWIDKLQTVGESFVEPLDTYKGLLDEKTEAERVAAEKTAASTDSSTDSWEDYATDVTVSLDELATRLEEQLLAQDNWRANIATITQRGGLEVGQILAAMGEEGVQLAAQMANGTDAEFDRMARLLIEDAHRGGAGAAVELDKQMKVMAAYGAAGGKATVGAIAAQLGIGVGEVARIAEQYGIQLIYGINPILGALGKNKLAIAKRGGASRYDQAGGGYADGGWTGPGGKYTPAGIVHGNEYVEPSESVNYYGTDIFEALHKRQIPRELLDTLTGYSGGGFVSTASVPRPPSTAPYRAPISTAGDAAMGKVYGDTVDWLKTHLAPQLGSGVGYQAMMAALRGKFPGLPLISGFRPGAITATGNRSYHSMGRAVDIPPDMGLFNWIAQNYRSKTRELIFSPAGSRQLWNGQNHVYGEPTRGDHWDHVHWAMANGGIIGEPVIGRGLRTGASYSFGERGPETVTPGIQSREFSGGGRGGSTSVSVAPPVVKVYLDGQEWRGIARVEAAGVVVDAFTGATDRGNHNR